MFKVSTIIGENFKVYDHNLKYNDHSKLIKDQGFNLGEVNIGDNSVIGANCLIYKSIPANTIVKNVSNLVSRSY